MKQMNRSAFTTVCAAFFFITIGCTNSDADKTTDTTKDRTQTMATQPDPQKLKTEIQEQETAWANADNARDVAAVAAFYSDDAVSMANNQPMLVGNAAIKKDIDATIEKRAKGATISYDVMDVFGAGDYVTEVGKTTRKDSNGKISSTGKYMALWEKRNGKWICIRDIGNEDAKEK